MEPIVSLKIWIIPVAALIPMVIGFIWYNPNVFGKAWMKFADMTDEKMKGAKMAPIFIVSYIFSCLVGAAILTLSIHQLGFQSMVMKFLETGTPEQVQEIKSFYSTYGNDFRTFKHGALHGFIGGFLTAFPILGTNALFERKSWSYILLNTGYWVVSMTIMGGVICQFA